MATYKIDPAHSDIYFKVKHLAISTVIGSFKTFDATLEAENEDFSDLKVTFETDVNSISTNNEQRDEHLKSADFFDVEKFPKLSFQSTSVEKDGDVLVVKGDLTLHGVTNPIELQAEYNGAVVDPYGQSKIGFDIRGKIKRKDFGLTWSAVTDAGGIVVSDEVRLELAVQFIKQA
ncbi:MAG: YceI family protein [Chitinophagaceae bacterium]